MSGFAKNGVLYPSGLVSEEYIKNIANECTPLKTVDMLGLDATITHSIDEILSLLPNTSMIGISTNGLLESNRADIYLVGNTFIEKTSEGRVTLITTYKDSVYSGYLNDDNTFGGWNKVCTTSVPDVPLTQIKGFKDTNIIPVGSSCCYSVSNGWCFLSLEIVVNAEKQYSWDTILDNSYKIPIPKTKSYNTKMVLTSGDGEILVASPQGGTLCMVGGAKLTRYYGSISYPVADDWRP